MKRCLRCSLPWVCIMGHSEAVMLEADQNPNRATNGRPDWPSMDFGWCLFLLSRVISLSFQQSCWTPKPNLVLPA